MAIFQQISKQATISLHLKFKNIQFFKSIFLQKWQKM